MIFTISVAAAVSPRVIAESDFQTIVGIGSPVLSPDGRSAIAIVSHIAWDDDKRNSDLVEIDLATRAQHILVTGRKGLSSAAFSPNGSSISFLASVGSGDDEHAQLFTMPAAGGDAKQMTNAPEGVEQYAWRPDSLAIAYASEEGTLKRSGAARFEDSFVFTTQPIVDRDPPHAVHLFLIATSGGTAQQLTFGGRSVVSGEAQSTLAWSPNGSDIAFTIGPDPILNDESYSRVAILDVATKRLRFLTKHTAWESGALWAPSGRQIAYVYSNGDSQVTLTQLYVTQASGGNGTSVSASLDRDVNDVAWAPDSRAIYFSGPDETTVALYRAAFGEAPRRISLGGLVLRSSLQNAVASDGAIVFAASSAKRAPELYYRTPSGSIERLTDFNSSIDALDLASAHRIEFPTTLGIRGDGVLLTPPGFTRGKRYPLVVFIHGGPTSSSTFGFDFTAQLMAARGWLVLEPNYRGSNNLGLAYQRAVFDDPEAGPGQDVMSAVRTVEARGIVDERRIAVCGWSYGGIMTAWMISKYHIWAAAVSGASVNDWITDYGTADDSLADVDLFRGSPFVGDNAADWNRASAVWYAKDVTTPVLILSDVGDNRDPFATSSMYWRALRDNHKNATLRVWPVNGHFPGDPVRQLDVFHHWIAFIANHF